MISKWFQRLTATVFVACALSVAGYANPCTAAITLSPSPTFFTFPSGGGSSSLTVNTGGTGLVSCFWTLTSSPFIHASPISGGGGSQFNFTVNFSVDPNPDLQQRTGFITVQQTEDGSKATDNVPQAASPGTFSISVSPSSQNVAVGGSAQYAVSITRTGGFNGNVALGASGQPSGASVSFNPNPASGASSTMTVAPNASVCDNTYGITVIGTNAIVQQTAPASATVVGDFSVSVIPGSEAVIQGGSTSLNVEINRTQGFAAPVALAVSGQPSGATVSLNPNTTTGNSSTLTISAAAGSPIGSFPLVVSGTTPCFTHTTPDTLSVSPLWWPAAQKILDK